MCNNKKCDSGLVLRQIALGLAALSLAVGAIAALSTFGTADIDSLPWATFDLPQSEAAFCTDLVVFYESDRRLLHVSVGAVDMLMSCGEGPRMTINMENGACFQVDNVTQTTGFGQFCKSCSENESRLRGAAGVSLVANIVGLGYSASRIQWQWNSLAARTITVVVAAVLVIGRSIMVGSWLQSCYNPLHDDTDAAKNVNFGFVFWLLVLGVIIDIATLLLHSGGMHNTDIPIGYATPFILCCQKIHDGKLHRHDSFDSDGWDHFGDVGSPMKRKKSFKDVSPMRGISAVSQNSHRNNRPFASRLALQQDTEIIHTDI